MFTYVQTMTPLRFIEGFKVEQIKFIEKIVKSYLFNNQDNLTVLFGDITTYIFFTLQLPIFGSLYHYHYSFSNVHWYVEAEDNQIGQLMPVRTKI